MGRGYVVRENPKDELGGASGSASLFTVQFVGKSASEGFPYTVANEIVAASIGMALGLPVAPGIADEVGGQPYFFSQRLRKHGELQEHGELQVGPPASTSVLESFVAENPLMIHGAVVFDLFLANNDRAFAPERRNLALDDDGRLFLYDHGNACFYRHREAAGIVAGVDRLGTLEASLGAMFDMDHKGNIYWELLTDLGMTDFWLERVKQIPDFMIDALVDHIPPAVNPPNANERKALAEFLKKRRHYLRDHILADKKHFPKLGGKP